MKHRLFTGALVSGGLAVVLVVQAVRPAVAIAAAGGVTCETVVLITPEEMDAATGQSVKYKPPGA